MNDAHDAQTDQATPYMRLPWPLVAVGLLGLLAVVLAIGLFANRYLRPQVGLAATPEAAAIAAAPAATPATVVPTPIATTPTPIAHASQTLIPTTGAVEAVTPAVVSVTPTPLPTVNPALAEEVSQAYEHYWQVRAEALFKLDDSKLQEVMDGSHLASVEGLINELQSEGRAIETNIDHSYTVLEVSNVNAEIVDTYMSNSIYIDATTHTALTQPSGDRLKEMYELSRVEGTWKVVSLASIH